MNEALVCIPTYNEKENIEKITDAVLQEFKDGDILIIDDNSPDGTGKIADSLALKNTRVQVLHRKNKEGLGPAYIAAFTFALEHNYKYIIEFDADFSHNPVYLPQMFNLLKNGADVVVGSRRIKNGGVENWSLLRKAISAGGSIYAGLILGIPVKDLTGGFNGFKSEALRAINYAGISAAGYIFQVEIKYRCHRQGLTIQEMPIIFPDRVSGKSKMSGSIFKEAFLGVLKLRFSKKQ
jgi:dolichol-phosphate mannosyltransferase